MIILVLLPSLVLSADSLIDWRECTADNDVCFCPRQGATLDLLTYKTTIPSKTARDKIEEAKKKLIEDQQESLAGCAKVGIESKFFDANIALFRMQVMGDDTKNVGDNPEQKLYQGDEFLFGCKFEKGQAKLIEEDPDNNYKLSLFEDRSRFIKGEMAHCAILSKAAKKINSDLIKRKLTADNTKLKLENGAQAISYELTNPGNILFKAYDAENTIKCNPYSIMDLDASQKYKIFPLINRDKMNLNCKNYGELYNLRYKILSSEEEGTLKELRCIYSDEFYWNIVKEDESIAQINEPELYQFYCAANFEKVCEDPRENCPSGHTCPIFDAGNTTNMATIKCTDQKWLIDGEYHKLESDPTCRKDAMKDNGATFYAKLPSNATKEIDKNARCFTDYDCKSKSNLALPQGDDVSSLADDGNGILKCKDKTRILTIVNSANNITLNESSSYTCDPNDGKWKNETIEVPINSRVRCIDVSTAPRKEKQEVTFTEEQAYAIIIGAVVALYAVLFIIAGICHCARKNKYNLATKMTPGMKKMNRTKLIANCKEAFREMLMATPSDAHLIVDGLNKIHLLLKEEVADPEVWEEAYKLVMRLHAAFRVSDMPLRHMFARYLYLQAKQIVDKYGWTAATPIRNQKRDGLMRAVALRLLSFSFENKTSPESAELVFRAFRELGWKGMSQYPHAGVAWSLIYHMRPYMYESATDKTRKAFDEDKFINTLRDILSSTVEMKINGAIPAFGSVAQQAAYALGSCPNFHYLSEQARDIITKTEKNENGAVPKRLFEGICLSPYRNPIAGLLEFFNMTARRDEKFLALMNAVAPEGDWHRLVEEAARVATYYGRHLDVKTIYERFMPLPGTKDRGIAKSAHANVDFVKMQMEQKLFEAAIESSKADIRAWLAAHTDKAEFKQKPDYSANPKGDHFVGEFKPLKDGCGDKFDAKLDAAKSSRAGSDTKSSENAKPASDPKEAAAAAAATPATP